MDEDSSTEQKTFDTRERVNISSAKSLNFCKIEIASGVVVVVVIVVVVVCFVLFLFFVVVVFCCPIICADLRGAALAPLVPASPTSGHTQGSFRIAAPPPEVHRRRRQIVGRLPSEGNTALLLSHFGTVQYCLL